MNVLVLGGTQFVGRHIVEALLDRGHAVTTFNRGVSPDDLPATIERLRGDRNDCAPGIKALAGRSWDACVDVSGYIPAQVRPAVELLRERVGRYVFISAVSVNGDPTDRPVLESHPLLPPAAEAVTEVSGETYGPLKVACERIVRDVFGERCTILRPQIVAGPHDPSGRFTYWVKRAALGGEVLAPGDGSDHVQVIDAHDLARFTVNVVEREIGGVFNLAGPRITWAEFMHLLGAENPVWVGAETLQSAGLTFNELPLYRPELGARASLMDVSSEKAQAAGLKLTDPARTVRDVRDWCQTREIPRVLSAERETELMWKAQEGVHDGHGQ